jgi:hypothetical protein
MDGKPDRHLPSHVFNLALLVIGGMALVVMVRRLGLANARDVLVGVGAWYGVIVALDVAGMCCDAAAIHAFMRPEARMVSYWRVLAAQASGRAINILTPGGALGEPTKVTMLVSHAPRSRVVSSIVLYNLAAFYLSVAIILIGVPITALLVDMPHELQVVVWVGLAVLVPVVIGIGIVIHRGALGTVLDTAVGLRILKRDRADRLKTKLAEIDGHLRELQTNRSPGTRLGLALIGASRLIGWAATMVTLHAVGVDFDLRLLIGVFSVGILIGWMSNLVPLGVGIADGGNFALYGLLGASSSHGLLMTMLGRARSLTIAVLGLLAMALVHTINRISIARRNTRFAALSAAHHDASG